MKLTQIIQETDKGTKVHWKDRIYIIVKDNTGDYFIKNDVTKETTPLYFRDKNNFPCLNGDNEDFYLGVHL